MDLVSPIWTIVSSSWDCISHRAEHVRHLEEKSSSLRQALNELKGMHEDLETKVAHVREIRRKVVSKQVEDWLCNFQGIKEEVDLFLQKIEAHNQRRCFARCCHCRSSYRYGKQAVKFLGVVNDMKEKGSKFDDVGFDGPLVNSLGIVKTEGLSEFPMDEKVVGMETSFDMAWRHLHDDCSKIIGLYGMGGVGKTTLLKKINNTLFKTNNGGFDLVIWVLASKQATVGKVQDSILRELNIPGRDKNELEKARLIHSFLQERRFILMLDDLWEFIDLVDVGVHMPSCHKGHKVVFTTRSEAVCGQMNAHPTIKVRCLEADAAWSLFRDKVGEATLNFHPEIPNLAQLVAKECDGLPLALITIGRAMANRKTPSEWKCAIQVLKTYPAKYFNPVLSILKFSYDSLDDETVKTCFLYCSLFPEDYEILNHDLVDLWIGEGYLTDSGGIYDTRNYGLSVIETLKLACLLEEGQSEVLVKMHDVIRDMALWIACGCGCESKMNRFLTQERFNSMDSYGTMKEQPEVERVSLSGDDVRKVLQFHRYPHLITCLIRETSLITLPNSFSQFAPRIKVLDLSENKRLNELPNAIGSIVTLQYLNLSKTELKTLPEGLKNLRDLRYLLLDFMSCLEGISPEIIASFSHLRIFRMNYSLSSDIKALLDASEAKEGISEMSIYIPSYEAAKKLMTSNKLQTCLRNLRIEHCNDMSTFKLSSSQYLESLHIYNTPSLKQIQIIKSAHLSDLQCAIIYRCSQVVNLNFLLFAPNIQSLWVSYCESLQDMVTKINSRGSLKVFSNLRKIRLDNLPHLKSICPRMIASPSLEKVYISNCPELRKIPFIPDVERLSIVRADREWFRTLEWEDESAESHFCHKFKALAVSKDLRTHGFMIEHHWPESRDLYQTRAVDDTPFDCSLQSSREQERRQLLWASTNM